MISKLHFVLALVIATISLTAAEPAAELLRNPGFSLTEPLPSGVKKHFDSVGTTFTGSAFPRWWTVRTSAKVDFRKGALTIQSASAKEGTLETRNYRIPRKSLGEYGCTITVKAKGKGKVTAGLYCYNAKGKFIISINATDSLTFDGSGVQTLSQLIKIDKLTHLASQVAVFLRIEGEVEISQVSCKAAEPQLPTPSEEFKKLPEQEKVSQLKASSDWQFAAAALDDRSQNVRNIACYQLGNFGAAAAPVRMKLAEMVSKDSYQPVRVHAARALANMGPVAHETIRDILLGNDGTARLTMGTVVLGMKEIPASLKAVLEWSNPPVSLFNSSTLPDGNFEASEGKNLVGWTVEFKDGAQGDFQVDSSVAYQGEQSLKITKTNGKGYILLRSTMPVGISTKDSKNPVTFRFFFKSSDASYNTLLLARFINEAGNMINDDPSINGGRGIMSQSRLRNTPPQAWTRRSIMYKPRNQAAFFYPAILLYGNPTTVWLDAVQYPAVPFKVHESAPTRPEPRYTVEEASAIIAKKPEAKLQLRQEENGKLSLVLNQKSIAPILHIPSKSSDSDFHYMHALGNVQLHGLVLNTAGNLRYEPFEKPVTMGKINKELIISQLEQSLRHAPDATYILNLKAILPTDFVTQYPEEAWLNAKGEKAYGNEVHVKGFGTFTDPECFYWPSQYSEKGWQMVEELTRDLLVTLKSKPYAKAIAGVFVTGGHDGQFMIGYDDYSKPGLQAWRDFLKERYGTDQALAAAWHQPGMTFAKASIPAPVKNNPALQGQFLLDPAKYQANIDYREFKEARMWQNAGRFARLFKEVFGEDKFAMTYCMGGGWKKNFKAFYDCGFDAFVPQASYYNRLPGLSGGVNMVDGSFLKHKKLVVAELDTRSWVRSIYNEVNNMALGVPFSKRHFQNLILKEAGRQLAHGHGYWFYDISNNSFRHPAAMEVIRKIGNAAQDIAAKAAEDTFAPGVALVYHQQSIFYDAPFGVYTGNWASEILDSMAFALRRSGVPMTAYFLEDLLTGDDYKKHKIFVFMNAHKLTAQERNFIDTKLKKDGNTLVWIHSTGMIDDHKLAPELTAKLTGFDLKYDPTPRDYRVDKCEFKHPLSQGLPMNMGAGDARRRYIDLGTSPQSKYLLPCFDIVDSKALMLGKFANGNGALAVKEFKDWTSVFCAAPGGLDNELLYNLATKAGVYTVTKPGLLCEVNGAFLSLHVCVTGNYNIRLPQKCATVKDAITGQILAKNTDTITLQLTAWESRWITWN